MLKGEKIIMAKLLGTDELKDTVNFQYSKHTVLKESKELRKFNVLSFNALSRKKLEYGNIERRLCLYETQNGEKIYNSPSTKEIQKYCLEQVDTLWDEVQRFEKPHNYYVDLSQKLWDERKRLLDEHGNEVK